MIATTILLLASIAQPELAPQPREMEVLPAPREVAIENLDSLRLRTGTRLRLADDFRDLESLSLRDLERRNRPFTYTPYIDPFQKTKEEREKDEQFSRDLKKLQEYSDSVNKQSRAQSERKFEMFGIVIVLAVIFTILRGIFALGAASAKSTSTGSSSRRDYPEWMNDGKDKH